MWSHITASWLAALTSTLAQSAAASELAVFYTRQTRRLFHGPLMTHRIVMRNDEQRRPQGLVTSGALLALNSLR